MRGWARTVAGVAGTIALVGAAIATVGIVVSPSASAATTSFVPVADTYVDAATPAVNYGTSAEIDADASPTRRLFLKFNVAGVTGTITNATLRLHVRNLSNAGSTAGGALKTMTNTAWSETAVTWNNQPALDGTTLANLGAVAPNTWYDIDVTAAITANGTYSLGMTSPTGDGVYYDSRETGTTAPVLTITTGTAPPPPSTVSFVPVADTYVDAAAPAVNFGTSAEIDADASPARRLFLKFNVAGVTGTITNATLRLHVRNLSNAGSTAGGALKTMTNTAWSETAVTWNNQPAIDGTTLANLGAVAPNTWYDIDVTAAITANGTYSLGMTSPTGDGVYYDSRETGTTAPVLTITTGTAPPPPSTVSFVPVADTYVDAAAPAVNFGTSAEIDADASPARRLFLKFNVAGVTGTITNATLRLHVRNLSNAGSTAGGALKTMTNTAWSETAVTWNNQPAIDGTTLANLGAVAPNTWYDIDVTAAITANGTYSLGMTSPTGDGVYYDSRETGTTAPVLTITTGTTSNAVILAAGDIASCSSSGDEATAAVLAGQAGTVVTLGDNVYDTGTPAEFTNCYGPSWGAHKSRTRPTIGNHEYGTAGASGYFGYFGAAAGPSGLGYYSFDVGDWHIVSLNTNCTIVSCAAGSPQEQWLRADLAANPRPCVAAVLHHPRFGSGMGHGSAPEVQPLWQALYDLNAELVLSGHEHVYERFAPLTPTGVIDSARGLRSFVVGTGGKSHGSFGTPISGSEVRNTTAFGVLKVTLQASSYSWNFLPVAGQTFTDSGTQTCH